MTNTSPTLNSAALAEKLAGYGIDIADAMERMLDNAELYKKLAMHYFDDTNYEALVADMKVGDYETAYTHAHTLKGASESFMNLPRKSATRSLRATQKPPMS